MIHNAAAKARRGFTLIELLVVVSILVVVMLITLPVVSNAVQGNRIAAGVNTVSVVAASARPYATRSKPDLTLPGGINADYSGTGIIFTPSGEARLVENNQYAQADDGSGTFLEDSSIGKNGYTDIPDQEYIRMPRGVGVVGLARGGSGHGKIILFAPPFAVLFDEYGHLMHDRPSGNAERMLLYDGNYNSLYENTQSNDGGDREHPFGSDPYVPEKWDPESGQFDSSNWNEAENKYTLPFEQIDPVVGVLVYDKAAFENEGHNLTSATSSASGYLVGQITDAAEEWILANGQLLLFDRYAGTVYREIPAEEE